MTEVAIALPAATAMVDVLAFDSLEDPEDVVALAQGHCFWFEDRLSRLWIP